MRTRTKLVALGAMLPLALTLTVASSATAKSSIDPPSVELTLAPGESKTILKKVTASGDQQWIKGRVLKGCELNVRLKPRQRDLTTGGIPAKFKETIEVPEDAEPYTELHCKVKFTRLPICRCQPSLTACLCDLKPVEIGVQEIWVTVLPEAVLACRRGRPTRGCQVNGVSNQRCVGTGGSDVILGTEYRDVIYGRGGDDYIVGFEKSDVLCGGPGDDKLIGNGGGDLLAGEGGDDHLEALGGRDGADGGPGNDYIDGGAGTDTCTDPNDGNQTFPFIDCP